MLEFPAIYKTLPVLYVEQQGSFFLRLAIFQANSGASRGFHKELTFETQPSVWTSAIALNAPRSNNFGDCDLPSNLVLSS